MLCELCQSDVVSSFHHFIPRTLHSNKWFKKRFTRAEMATGIDVCSLCHSTIHQLIPSEKELGRHYHSSEDLAAHPEIAKYLAWRRAHPPRI